MQIFDQLNQQYAIPPYVSFIQGKGELPFISLNTPSATATISLLGGQVLAFQPAHADHDLLFVSNNAYYQAGKAIKGGAPICWPWFAAHPDNASLPFHGLVRNQVWKVESTHYHESGDVVITLSFTDTELSRQVWPHAFELKEVISIGDKLGISLITTNPSAQAIQITQAIHTYFRVGDINQVQVTGLENSNYLDKVEQFKEKRQDGPITVTKEVDRIYQRVGSTQTIHDRIWNRKIHITPSGSNTCVVWNPWCDISQQSKDLENDDYLRFICVETANAAQDIVTIEPGQAYTLGVEYDIENTALKA